MNILNIVRWILGERRIKQLKRRLHSLISLVYYDPTNTYLHIEAIFGRFEIFTTDRNTEHKILEIILKFMSDNSITNSLLSLSYILVLRTIWN